MTSLNPIYLVLAFSGYSFLIWISETISMCTRNSWIARNLVKPSTAFKMGVSGEVWASCSARTPTKGSKSTSIGVSTATNPIESARSVRPTPGNSKVRQNLKNSNSSLCHRPSLTPTTLSQSTACTTSNLTWWARLSPHTTSAAIYSWAIMATQTTQMQIVTVYTGTQTFQLLPNRPKSMSTPMLSTIPTCPSSLRSKSK